MKDSAYVNQFYLETRYPSDIPIDISHSEAQECIQIARKVLAKTIDQCEQEWFRTEG
jgi:HEPN domain-containing protein